MIEASEELDSATTAVIISKEHRVPGLILSALGAGTRVSIVDSPARARRELRRVGADVLVRVVDYEPESSAGSLMLAALADAAPHLRTMIVTSHPAGVGERLLMLRSAGGVHSLVDEERALSHHIRSFLAATSLAARRSSVVDRLVAAIPPTIQLPVRRVLDSRRETEVALLAYELGLTRRTIERRFRAAGATPPSEMLSCRRAFDAALLRERTLTPVARVAELVGFKRHSDLSAILRRTTGVTPSAVREQGLADVVARAVVYRGRKPYSLGSRDGTQ
jgi:AraC-like DNA-binding protein